MNLYNTFIQCCTFTGMYINHFYNLQKKKILSLLLVNCTVTLSENLYFLISTLFSVKLKNKQKNIYIYLKVYYFIMKYLF